MANEWTIFRKRCFVNGFYVGCLIRGGNCRTLREHLGYTGCWWGSCCLSSLLLLCCVVFWLYWYCVLCDQCCQCFWIVHSIYFPFGFP